MAMTNEIVKFAAGNEAVKNYFEAVTDYELHRFSIDGYDSSVSLSKKNEKLNEAFLSAVEAKAGVTREDAKEAWMAHPAVKWAAMSIVDATINSLLPIVVFPNMNDFVDLRTTAYGDIVHFKVMPRELFTVSLGGHGERTTLRQKNFNGDVIVNPVEHIITVYTDMYSVLAGKEDLGEMVRLAILSIQETMSKDAITALSAGLTAGAYPQNLVVTGAFSKDTLITLAETVEALNYGQRPIIMGTASALAKVLPDSTAGFRGIFEANGGSIDIMKNFYGYDLVRMRQFVNAGTTDLALDPNTLYVISPAADKLIKGVVTNTLSNGNQFYDNADLTSNFTTRKDWGFLFASAARAAKYVIND